MRPIDQANAVAGEVAAPGDQHAQLHVDLEVQTLGLARTNPRKKIRDD
jgi:hypothetical protein